MKLAASNIGWKKEQDTAVYSRLQAAGFCGLEVAPTRIFESDPYAHISEAGAFAKSLKAEYSLQVCSLQSIWFGRKEQLFGSEEERTALFTHTRAAFVFANALGCGNLVFGSPKNRQLPKGVNPALAIPFFTGLAAAAKALNTTLAIEANPAVYGTNFLNTTAGAACFIQTVGAPGLGLNLDFGTLIANGEDVAALEPYMHLVNHVHISEVNLAPIVPREGHRTLAALLHSTGYSGYISIEMKADDSGSLTPLYEAINYLQEVFL